MVRRRSNEEAPAERPLSTTCSGFPPNYLLCQQFHMLALVLTCKEPYLGDIFLHPFQRFDLVANPDVRRSFLVKLPTLQESVRSHAVVDRYNDYVTISGKVTAVVIGV